LRDVGDEPGALPLLSHALLETWKRRAGHTLTLKGYADAGGVRGAIAHTAESVYQNLSSEEQTIARNIFLRLTELGEGTEDTRRRASFDELISHADAAHADEVRSVLNILAEARLVMLGEDNAEVAHEALIREWPALREWLNQDRESLRLHRHLTEAAHEWELLERDAGALYRGAHLAQAREWAILHPHALNVGERAFLDASNELEQREAREREEQQKRELEAAQRLAETEKARAQEQAQSIKQLSRRALYLFTVLVIAVIAAIAAGVFANQNSTLASANASVAAMAQAEAAARATQQSIAEANFIRAEAQRLAAEATNIINTQGTSETAALLTLRSLNLEYTPQGDAALLSAIHLNYPVQVFTGNQAPVTKVAFSPDGTLILTGSEDGTVRLFDGQSGEQIQVFHGHTADITDIAFSPDGNMVLTGSWDQTARLWDTATGKELKKLVGHTNMVITVAFSLDGKQVLTGSEDKTLRLWDVTTGRELNRWFIEEPVSAFSPDGRYAVGYSEIDNANHLWDIKTLTKTHSFSYSGPPFRNPIQFSSDGNYLLAAYGKEMVLSDVTSGQEVQIFTGHTNNVTGLALSPDGKYALSASFDKTVRLWDIETGEEIRRFSSHGEVKSMAFSSDGQRILTGGLMGGTDGVVLLWDIEPHSELPMFNQGDGMYAAAFSPDGKFLATNVISNELQVWNVSTGQTLWSAEDSGLALWALAFSPDGKYLTSGNMDGVTTLWDANTGKRIRQFTAQGLDEINGLTFSPDGKTLLAGGTSLGIIETFAPIWDVESGREILRIPLPAPVFTVSFSPDSKYILTGGGGSEGISQLWNAQTGTKLREFTGNVAKFSPDGKFVVTVLGSTGFLWDVQTGKELRHFDGPADGMGPLVYAPDGKTIASASWDGSVRLWDVQTGQELRRYPQPAEYIVFSPDGKYLVIASADGIARFFDVDYRTTMKYLCSILLRDFTDDERTQYNITDNKPTCPP
jgi:WD40 repeat protein